MKDNSAFPASAEQVNTYGTGYMGLTKRELFAAMAMQGMMVNRATGGVPVTKDAVAEVACGFADALLKALENNETTRKEDK